MATIPQLQPAKQAGGVRPWLPVRQLASRKHRPEPWQDGSGVVTASPMWGSVAAVSVPESITAQSRGLPSGRVARGRSPR